MKGRRKDLEVRLADLGIAWSFELVDLADVDRPESTSQQYRIETVNEATVERYAADMARGDTFPAILARKVRNKLVLLGGMHRHTAAVTAGLQQFPCYVVECTAAQGRRLSFEDNRTHGLPLTPSERAELAARLVELDNMTQVAAAELVGVPVPNVSQALAGRTATRRASELGVDLGLVSPSSRSRLNMITDPGVFAEAAELAASTRMSTDAVNRLVIRVTRSESIEEALDQVDTLAAGYVRGTPGNGNRRAARGRLIDAVLELLDCDPAEVAGELDDADGRSVMSDRLKRAARHLMAIDKAIGARG